VTVTRNGQVVRTMPASAGRDAYATHNGIYYNGWRAREVRMDSETWGLSRAAGGYDTVVNDGVRLSYDGIFIHSAPWSVADQGVRNVSHGCINLSPDDAAWYYDNTRNGDPFIVVGGPGRQFGAFDGQGDWNY
ncbi:MAG: L,D-transpeptidase, partial [Dietzia sp.]